MSGLNNLVEELLSLNDENLIERVINTNDVQGCLEELCAILNDEQQAPGNDPLTLEELREMGGEPVWVQYIKQQWGRYYIVRAIGKNSVIFDECDKEFGSYKSLFLGFYGKTWLAYRHKPEEADHGQA